MKYLIAIVLSVMTVMTTSWAYEDENLPPVTIINSYDLQKDGQLSKQTQKPILILFSMKGCSYCEFVEEEHLKHLGEPSQPHQRPQSNTVSAESLRLTDRLLRTQHTRGALQPTG